MKKKHQKITINDLAKQLDTTPATVSRALNNHPRISAKMKEKVQALAKEYNYQPNVVASNFRTGKTKSVGIVVPFINRHFFSNAIHSIETELVKADYTVMICQTFDDPQLEEKLINMLINNKVSGIIISSAKNTNSSNTLQKAIDNDIKVVQFDGIFSEIKSSCIRNTDFSGSKATVTHLLEQGYRHIALFCGNLSSNIYQDRKAGFLEAHKEWGITPNAQLFFEHTNTQEEGKAAALQLLAQDIPFDAVFSSGDYAALGAYLVFKGKGIRIPEEIGIAGYANEPFTEFVSPSITSSEQNSQGIGRKAAIQILKEIEINNTEMIDESVPSQLIIRDSTLRNH